MVTKKEPTSAVFGLRHGGKKNPSGIICYECGGKGHIARDHRNGMIRDRTQGAPRKSNLKDGKGKELSNQGKSVRFATARNKERCNKVIASSFIFDTDFVMDSGASEHMVKDIRFFEDLCNAKPIIIETADGSRETTNKKGRVRVRFHNRIMLVQHPYGHLWSIRNPN